MSTQLTKTFWLFICQENRHDDSMRPLTGSSLLNTTPEYLALEFLLPLMLSSKTGVIDPTAPNLYRESSVTENVRQGSLVGQTHLQQEMGGSCIGFNGLVQTWGGERTESCEQVTAVTI